MSEAENLHLVKKIA